MMTRGCTRQASVAFLADIHRVVCCVLLLQVSAGAHLDVADFEGLLPLHQAACTGNVEFAKLLVEADAPINLHTVKYITQVCLASAACGGHESKRAYTDELTCQHAQ